MRRKIRFWLWVVVLVVIGSGLAFRFWPHQPLAAGVTADKILVDKSARTLALLRNGEVIASYRVALGRDPHGPKAQKDDGRTPEGRYVVSARVPNSHFYRALKVSYPNAEDRQRADRMGVPAGDDIMVHGIKNGLGWLGRLHRLVDWTDGCIAVTNEEMHDIWNATARGGIAIEIRP
jgi:murein L,D-transpeptidase YafK